MTAWQPISTAPKDGTRVLLHLRRPYAGSTIMVEGVFHDSDWLWPARRRDGGGEYSPTHWMPLPEPPEGA